MKVSNTVVCLDCDELFDPKLVNCCPFCTSQYVVFLSRFFPSLHVETEKKWDHTDSGNAGWLLFQNHQEKCSCARAA